MPLTHLLISISVPVAYKVAYRVLKPGGIISFIDGASDTPLQFHFEELGGPWHIEPIVDYTSMLKTAGFNLVQHYDITELACKEILGTMYQQVTRRDQILEALGSEGYL